MHDRQRYPSRAHNSRPRSCSLGGLVAGDLLLFERHILVFVLSEIDLFTMIQFVVELYLLIENVIDILLTLVTAFKPHWHIGLLPEEVAMSLPTDSITSPFDIQMPQDLRDELSHF